MITPPSPSLDYSKPGTAKGERTAGLCSTLSKSALLQQVNYPKKENPPCVGRVPQTPPAHAVRHKTKALQLHCKAQRIHGAVPHILPVFSELQTFLLITGKVPIS